MLIGAAGDDAQSSACDVRGTGFAPLCKCIRVAIVIEDLSFQGASAGHWLPRKFRNMLLSLKYIRACAD